MSDTAKRVRKVIAAKFNMDDADLVSEASFLADLGADSLDIVEISMAIEKEFDIEIFDDDIESTKTLGAPKPSCILAITLQKTSSAPPMGRSMKAWSLLGITIDVASPR